MESHRKRCGTWLKRLPNVLTSRIWLYTTCVAPALGYAIWQAENWSRYQFLLGHASVQTTERYLGCKQKLSQAVNDNLGLEDA